MRSLIIYMLLMAALTIGIVQASNVGVKALEAGKASREITINFKGE